MTGKKRISKEGIGIEPSEKKKGEWNRGSSGEERPIIQGRELLGHAGEKRAAVCGKKCNKHKGRKPGGGFVEKKFFRG